MHLIDPVRSCIDTILQISGPGMKSLVLDDFTTGVISVGYTRSEMLLREVYLFERIDTLFESDERLNIMKCLVILRPTKDNVQQLCRELDRPHYRTYHIYFTSRIGPTLSKKLAEADETEVVRCIKELPLDYTPVTPFLFNIGLLNQTFDLRNDAWLPDGLKRASDGLSSVLVSLQINPIIRYQTQYSLCKALAERVSSIIKNESLANKTWRESAPFDVNSLLIIIDRRSDLVTPIVNKWTYYEMIHEHFSIRNNQINLANVPNRKPKDPKEMLISVEQDQFFGDNYYKSYGDLSSTLKEAIEQLKEHSKSKHKIETMDDMKKFIDEYPETKKYTTNLHKHIFLMSELSRIVAEHNLIPLSECEQEIACSSSFNNDLIKKVKSLVPDTKIRPLDAIRLVSLYIVCHKDKKVLADLIKLLKSRNDVDKMDIEFLSQLRDFCLSKPYNPLDETVQQVTRMIVQGVKGVENALSQHRPKLFRILDDLKNGNKLKETEFAFYGERYREEPPKKVIVFYTGGVTYDEALVVDQFNRSRDSAIKVVIGGTSIHNFCTFKDEVREAMMRNSASYL